MDNAASITVAVRIRPVTEWEAARLPDPLDTTRPFFGDGSLASHVQGHKFGQFRKIIAYEEDGSLIYDPMDPQAEAIYRQKGYLPPGTYRYKHRKYQYDVVFGPEVTQQAVFERTTKPLLDGILDGYNGTVFAYGATGCGKTHTISGTPSDPGIIYATMAELFQRIDERREDYAIDVSLSFLEIYNEEIRDLLAPAGADTPRGGLAIRENSANRVTVAGLTEVVPTSADEVNAIVQAGNARRTQSPTHANATSSRSHAVLQINVTQSPRTPGVTEERTMATLSIIDLAGSERASATKNMGKRMVEGANINKSLLALGNCINALCEPKTRAHIPYRNSKLTRLLKFSLGGNCRTVMIVCVAPTSQHLEDTGNTLAYANRAKEIKTKVSKNIMDVDRHVGQYVEAINRLNDEVRELKAKLAGEMAVENEAVKRRRANAAKAVENVRAEIRALAAKSRTMLCAGSFTAGNTAASQAKLDVLRIRVKELDSMANPSSEVEVEKGLLRALINAEEECVRKEADTISKAMSSAALFATNIGLAQRRKGDDWDEMAPTIVKLEGDTVLAEMRAAQAEHERDGLKQALKGQAAVITTLVGMLARTNALMVDGVQMLRSGSEAAMSNEDIANRLQILIDLNSKTFTDVIGVAVPTTGGSKKTGFAALSTRPTTKRPSVNGAPPTRTRPSMGTRRTSLSGLGSPGRRHSYRSPRKPSSLRAGAITTTGRKVSGEKKSVRWAVPIKPDESYVEPSTPKAKVSIALPTSESEEWEDDRTDESSAVETSSMSLDAAIMTIGASTAMPSGSSSGPAVRKIKMDEPKVVLDSLKEEDEQTPRRTVLGEHNQQVTASASKARRRSGIGSLRSDRVRRRSSLIPQLSPNYKEVAKAAAPGGTATGEAPAKAHHKSPKRPKRSSLLGVLSSSRVRPSLLRIGVEQPPSGTVAKPSWK